MISSHFVLSSLRGRHYFYLFQCSANKLLPETNMYSKSKYCNKRYLIGLSIIDSDGPRGVHEVYVPLTTTIPPSSSQWLLVMIRFLILCFIEVHFFGRSGGGLFDTWMSLLNWFFFFLNQVRSSKFMHKSSRVQLVFYENATIFMLIILVFSLITIRYLGICKNQGMWITCTYIARNSISRLNI